MSKCKYIITLSDGNLLEVPVDFDENNEANLKKSLMNLLLNSSEDFINKVLVKEETIIPDKYKEFAVKKSTLKDIIFTGENNKLLNHIKNTFPELLSEENIIFTENYKKDYDYDSKDNVIIINAPTFDSDIFLKGILNKLVIDYNTSQNKNLKPTDSEFVNYLGGNFENTINGLYEFDNISEINIAPKVEETGIKGILNNPNFDEYFTFSNIENKEILAEKIDNWLKENNTSIWPTLGQLGILPKEQNFISLTENKNLYKSWGLLNNNGTFRTFNTESEKDKKFLKDLNNRSIYYSFYFRKGPNEKYRILAIENPIKTKINSNLRFKGKSVNEVLDTLSLSKKSGLATVAKRLSKLNLKTKILVLDNIEYNKYVSKNFEKDYKGTKGLYDKISDTVIVKEGTDEQVMLHELLHAATMDFLSNDAGKRQWFKDYVQKVIDKVGEEAKNHYGLTNELEFISEIMTNKSFIKFLDGFEPIYNNKTKSIWQELKEIISNWLGLKDSAAREGINAVSDLLDSVEETFVRDINYYNYDYRLMEQEFKYDEDSIKYSKELIKEGVNFVFEQNPELSNIGTPEEYSAYLDSIFPDSKMRDIVYHGTNADLSDGFSKEFSGSGSGSPIMRGDIYTTLQPETTLQYIKGVGTFENKTWTEQHFELKRLINEDNRNKPIDEDIINKIITSGKWKGKTIEQLKQEYNFKGSNLQFVKTIYGIKEGESFNDYKKRKHQEFKNIWHNKKYNKAPYSLIVNIKNPLIHKTQDTDYTNFIKQAEKNSNDGLIMYDNNDAFRSDVIVAFNPEQIHILGSKRDVEGFRNFVGKKELSNYKSTNPLKSYDSPDLLVSMVNILQDKFGVKINFIHDSELNDFQDVPEINTARAFTKNGEYFVNIDKANIAEPLHELLHMVLASMKYSNYDNYKRLVDSIENHPLYQEIVANYNEINSDILEETFITLFTETVRKNILASGIFTEGSFEDSVKNAITQMFDLDISLNRTSAYELLDAEVKDILFNFSSNLLENREETYNTDNAVKMMSLSSLYKSLMKEGSLIQKCNG